MQSLKTRYRPPLETTDPPDGVGIGNSEVVLDAEVRIGELMAMVPKAKGGQPFHEKHTNDTAVESRPKTKTEVIKEAGFTPKQVERFQTLAKHPEVIGIPSAAGCLMGCRDGSRRTVTDLHRTVTEEFITGDGSGYSYKYICISYILRLRLGVAKILVLCGFPRFNYHTFTHLRGLTITLLHTEVKRRIL